MGMRLIGIHSVMALLIILAALCPLQAVEAPSKIDQWRGLLNSDDAGARNMAALALLELQDEQAADAIRQVLRDPQKPASLLSILSAIKLRTDDRFTAEIVALLGSDEARIVDGASAALAAQKSPQAVDTMLKALRDPNHLPVARGRLAQIIAERHELKAVPVLVELLGADDASLRAAALDALEKLTMQSLGPDREAWQRWWQDRRDQPREAMLEEIIRAQAAAIQRLSDQLSEQWIKLLSAQDLAKDAKPLTEALTSDVPSVQIFAAKKVAEMRLPDGAAMLIPCLSSRDAKVRQAAAQALGEIGDVAGVGSLTSLLDDADSKVAAAAATSLGRLKVTDAAPALLRLLNRGAAESAASAARALGDIGVRQAVPALSEALLNEKLEGAAREEAAAALGKLNDPAALPALVSSLDSPDDRIRWAAADSLGRLGLLESVAPLGKTLASDKDPRVREVAALALGNIRSKEAVNFLLTGMNDSEQRVCDQSLAALLVIIGTNAAGYEKLAADLMQQGQNAKAALICRAAVDKLARDAPSASVVSLTRQIGFALTAAGQWADARKPLEQAFAADRNDKALCLKLAECYVRIGEREAAAAFGVSALKKFPDEATSLAALLAPALETLFEEGSIAPLLGFINALTPDESAGLPAELRDQLALLKDRCERIDEILAADIAALSEAPAEYLDAPAKAVARFVALGEKGIPYLVQLGLGSNDARVQDASMEALARLTGHPFGVEKGATSEQRQAAVKAWLTWWQTKTSGNPVPASNPAPLLASPVKRD